MTTQLIPISKIQRQLELAKDITMSLDIRDAAMAANILADARGMKDIAQEAKIIQLRAERKAGMFLDGLERGKGGGDNRNSTSDSLSLVTSEYSQALEDNNIGHRSSQRWQKEAKVPEKAFEEWINEAKDRGSEITQSGLLNLAKKGNGAHVGHASGENEWYTPIKFTDSARRVMGEIDLDPASSKAANAAVQAVAYFTEEDDGLLWEWGGKIWMNPPYSQPLIAQFCQKLAESIDSGTVEEAIVLVNNASETKWYQNIGARCSATCNPDSRIRFIDKEGKKGSTPLQGQTIMYFGPSTKADIFAAEFQQYGLIFYAR